MSTMFLIAMMFVQQQAKQANPTVTVSATTTEKATIIVTGEKAERLCSDWPEAYPYMPPCDPTGSIIVAAEAYAVWVPKVAKCGSFDGRPIPCANLMTTPEIRFRCADLSHVLLTSEDGKKWCLKVSQWSGKDTK